MARLSFSCSLLLLPLVQAGWGQERSSAQLERRLTEIDAEIAQLAQYSMRSGIGVIGFRSDNHPTPYVREWIQIDLQGEHEIDQVALAPCIWRDAKIDYRADAFPLGFRILVGTEEQENVVASFDENDDLLPRIAPLVIPFPPTSASWIRVETTKLSPRAYDGQYDFELSEVFVFSGAKNVALHKPVTVSSVHRADHTVRNKECLVDGFVPYLINAASGESSLGFLAPISPETTATLSIDLETPQPISQIFLHTIDQSDTVPQGYAGDLGIPKLSRIEGANRADFSDAELLAEIACPTIYDAGPIMMRNVDSPPFRFIRLTAVSPYITPVGQPSPYIGFAEIELLSKDVNVALGKKVSSNLERISARRPIGSLTDGRNLYGSILPIRDWLEQLARRHELEKERPIVAAELSLRYAAQKKTLKRFTWATALLCFAVGSTMLIGRVIRTRQMTRIKTRFAADLHDELGANLHSIGILSDIGEEAETQSEWKMITSRIREVTERTGTAVRHCTNMLESRKLFSELVADMRRTSDRISTNLEHTFDITGEPHLNSLPAKTGIDLFLFYKECLINICRHSEATQVRTDLRGNEREVNLWITDNGHGISEARHPPAPKSLSRRAKLMNAKLSVECPETGGTIVHLKLKRRRFSWNLFNKSTP